MSSTNCKVKDYNLTTSFQSMVVRWDDDKLQRELENYKRLVRIHEGNEPPKVNPVTKKVIEYTRMEWMLPAYRSGLEIVEAEIERRKGGAHA